MSTTRRCSPAIVARWPRRPPVCTSTPGRFDNSRMRGIGWATVTLHVGYGTFKPVRVENVEDHQVDRRVGTRFRHRCRGERQTRSCGRGAGSSPSVRPRHAPWNRGGFGRAWSRRPGRRVTLYLSGLSVQRGRCDAHELSSAEVIVVHAGVGTCRARSHARRVSVRSSGGISLLQLRRRHADTMTRQPG